MAIVFAFLHATLSAHRMQLGIITLLSVLMPAAAVLILSLIHI